MLALWKTKQWMYEWLLFLSIPSGIHSILTPEFTQGLSTYFIFDFYFVHAALIFIPLFLTFNRGMLPRRDAWRRSFFICANSLSNHFFYLISIWVLTICIWPKNQWLIILF